MDPVNVQIPTMNFIIVTPIIASMLKTLLSFSCLIVWKKNWRFISHLGQCVPKARRLKNFTSWRKYGVKSRYYVIVSKVFWRWWIALSRSLGLWTVSIVRYPKSNKKQRFGNWICFRKFLCLESRHSAHIDPPLPYIGEQAYTSSRK
jgi:hypothetical protein